jgi:hypothetical protein
MKGVGKENKENKKRSKLYIKLFNYNKIFKFGKENKKREKKLGL